MEDLPPPPYTPRDPNVEADGASQPVQARLRGGYIRRSLPPDVSNGSTLSSAVAYFEGRQPSFTDGGRHLNPIQHSIIFTRDTTRENLDFPSPNEEYIDRDVTGLDWSTFVNYLFPMPDETAAVKRSSEKHAGPRTHVEEDTPERRQRIQSVVAEWNERFFGPRLIHIDAEFAMRSSTSIAHSVTPLSAENVNALNGYGSTNLHRSRSFSSISSSISSSSSSSVDSIRSKDFDGADISQLRSALLAFRLDPTKKAHLRSSVRQLRSQIHSQCRDLSHNKPKGLKKEFKEQCKEIKREVKAVVKEVKTARKADRKLRKAERKCRRDSKRAETRGVDRMSRAQEKAQRRQERAQEKAHRVQERGLEAQERAAERANRARATADRTRAGGNEGSSQTTGVIDGNSEKARLAEIRAQEAINGIQNFDNGAGATAREQVTDQNADNQSWESHGGQQARQAERTARQTANAAPSRG